MNIIKLCDSTVMTKLTFYKLNILALTSYQWGMWDGKWQRKSFHLVRNSSFDFDITLYKLNATKFDQQQRARELNTMALL